MWKGFFFCKTFLYLYKRNDFIIKTIVLYVWKKNDFVMKALSDLVYICRGIYYNVHEYMLIIYVCMYCLGRISSFYIRIIVRLYVTDIKSHHYRVHYYGYSPIGPCLNYFLQTPIWGLVYINWLSSYNYLISHSVIGIDSLSVFPGSTRW